MSENKTNVGIVSTKFSSFMSTYGRWIAGILMILLLSWADERYVSHDELDIYTTEKQVDEIIPLTAKEADLRQRQEKKIKVLSDIDGDVSSLEKEKAVNEAVAHKVDEHLQHQIDNIKTYFMREIDRLEKKIEEKHE